MALSEAIRNRIRQNVENKVGVGSSESAAPSSNQSSSGLSSAMQERIRKNVTMKRLGREETGVDDDFISKFMNDYKLFSYKSQYDWSNMTWQSGMDSAAAAKRAETERDLAERATAIRTYLDLNKGSVDPGAFQELTSYLDQFDTNRAGIMHGFSSMQKYYSQWESEDAYDEYMFQSDPDNVSGRQKRYQENQAKIEALKEEKRKAGLWDKKEIQNQIDALETENLNYERGNQDYVSKVVDDYSRTGEQADFGIYSANRDFTTPTREELTKYDVMNDTSRWYFDANGVYRDAFGNELKAGEDGNWYNPNAKQPVTDRLGMFLNASEDELQEAIGESVGAESAWATVLKDGVDGNWEQLTENEVNIYYYLLNKSGQQTADKYLADMKTELNRRATNAYNQQLVKGFDEANMLEKIALSVATTPAQLFSGVAGTIENTANTLMGNEINPYSAAHTGMHFSQTVRGEQAAELDETGIRIPGIDFTLGDAYQAGMSILDSYAAIGIGGGMGGALLASSAAQSEATKLYEQGASMEQIALGSAAAGAAEMVFESVSIDKLINMKDAKTVGQMVKNALIQGGIEASEEGFTEIANIVTNAIIMGGQSDWAKLVEENGGSLWKALLSEVQTVAHSSLAGFLSGTGSATGPSAVSYAATQNQYADAGKMVKEYDQGVDVLMQLANEVAGVSKGTQKSLDKQISKVGKNASNVRVGKLYDTVSTAYSEQNQGDIAKSLERKGYSAKEASAIAEALAAESNGQQLTGKQERLLSKAKGDSRVQDAITNIVENKKSTMGQRDATLGGFTTQVAINHMAKEYAKAQEKAARTNPAGQGQENAAAAGKVEAQNKEAAQSHYEVSAEGKSIQVSTGKTVKITGIASVEKGKLVLQTEDGTVDAADVAYASQDEALVYEAVASLGGIIDADSATKLVKKFNPADGVSAAVYAKGIAQAYTYGYYGYAMAEATGADTMSGALTESQRNTAFAFGRVQRKNDGAKAQEQVSKYHEAGKTTAVQKKGGVYFRNNNMETSDIASHLESSGVVLNDQQAIGIETMQHMSEALGVEFYVFESYVKDGKRYYIDEDGVEQAGAPNGWYDKKTGRIYIDLHAGAFGKGTMLFTIAHELTHFIHQWSPAKFQKLADIIFTHGKMQGQVAGLVAAKMAKAKTRGKPISYEVAYEEVVADGMESILKSGRVMEMMADVKQQDRGMWQKICDWFKDLVKYMKRVVDAYRGLDPDSVEGKYVAEMKGLIKEIEAVYAEGLVEASENYQSFMSMATSEEIMAVENGTMFSYSALAEAAGFTAVENADGTRAFTRDGAKVSEVTVADIENSPIGAFINYSVEKKDISADDAKRQKEMFAQICTMACKTNDFAMTMQFVGSAVFTGMKANADKQYGTTYDFPSICTKTQAVIDAMSAKMVKLGRGLKSDEIVELYREVFASGNPVPCPECYVFSRWIGIGGLLDNIKKYQDYYGNMKTEDVAAAYLKMKAEVAKVAEEQGITFGKAKGALTSKITKEYNKLTEKIEKAQNQGEKVKPADLKRLAELEPMMNTVKGMTWLENVYFADSSLKKVNPRYRVPNEVLFDLNNGEAFAAKYKEAWAFRTTQGAGYGKAITPYAEAKLGEGILVTNNTTKTIKAKANDSLDNYFLQQKGKLDKKAREALDRARVKQKIQAFIGGQRFQSTSDARYENASDYLLAALEMQAMGGMVQVYTKVDGAVPAFSSWGFSINQSLMPLGGGLDADGNVVDTAVGGMSPKVAFKNRDKHETAGTITIGVNDNHIRAMFQQWVRDFIIPYHASGGKADVVAELRRIQEGQEAKGKMVRSTDYSRTQGDKVLSDEVLRWQGKTAEEIQRIHAVRDARIAILTGGSPNMEVVRSNRFLSALYDKLQGEWKGVKLAKSKVESQIFPNEFWDQSVGYENSGKITRDYLEYCDDLGFLHRFSGMVPSNGKLVPVNGYDQNGERVQLTDLAYKHENGQKTDQVEEFFWKVLTDRRMYDNEGNYLPQKVVTLNDTTTDTVTDFAKNNFGRQYNKELSMETAKKVANIRFSDRETLADAADAMEKITDEEYLKAISEHPFIIVMDHTPEVVLKSMEGEPKAADRRVLIRRDALYLAIRKDGVQEGHYHELGAEVLKKLPEYLANPDVILKTDNSSTRRMVLTSIPTKSGQAIISVEFESIKDFEGSYEYFNVIVTVFDLHKNYLKGLFKKRSAEIKYEKEDLVQVNPQLYEWLRIFNTKSSNDNVTRPEPEVKSESVRDSLYSDRDSEGNQLSEGQVEFFKDSVVRDKDGNLLVMYHGTADGGAFTVFDGDKLGNRTLTSQIGQGFYFTNVKKEAEAYMKNVDIYGRASRGKSPYLHQVHLNITNPFDVNADQLDLEKAKAVYLDGTNGYFFDSYIPFYLNKKMVNGRIVTKAEVQSMSKSDKVSAYVDYLAGFSSGTREVLSHMVEAFPYGKQSELLAAMKKNLGYDGIVDEFKPGQYQYVAFSSEQVKSVDNKNPTENPDIRYSERDEAPTFYSQMGKVIEGIKQEKFGASSVISMLRGRGVKAEEIRWSGIQAFLEGKKSVTKAELLEFIQSSMLQIEEEVLSDQEIPYSQEDLDQIAKFEAERDTVAEELKAEWKRIVGTDIPIVYFGAGLEHAVVNNLMEANATIKGQTEAGHKYKAARAALQRCIEYSDDYFGYDNERQAFREAMRNPQAFIDSFELTSFEKGVFRDFIKAKEAYQKAEGIPMQDQKTLIAIAASADRFSNRIAKVKSAHYAKAAKHLTKWGQYKIKGGSNYRELLFKIPGSYYYNDAMVAHWDNREGVLAHARIQDLNTVLGKMLFIEELQSDWHNDGHKDGYASEAPAVRKRVRDLAKQWDELLDESMTASATRTYAINEKMDSVHEDMERLGNKLKHGRLAPDAPFSENYHEYVLKRLIRMAAEQDYDSIGWTPAQIQVERWSEKFSEGYRIEYDQDMPKFMKKYGKQWGTTVGKTVLDNGTEVWSMAITDSMKESVLTEGQPLYQEREEESVSNRSLLANALETAAKDDTERAKIQEYKGKISLINAEEKKLNELNEQIKELSFAKGPRDTKKIRDLQFDAKQTANRINTYDKQLLRLEASKPLQDVLTREKRAAYKRAEQKGKEALAAYKEKAAKTQRELLDKWQDSRKKAVESREKTAMRHKIQNVVSELNNLLLSNDKKRHVPENLKKAVADALALVNMDTVGAEERAAKYAALIAKETDPDKIDAYTVTMENILRQGDKMGQRLKDLRDAYEEISESDDPDIANAYDPVIAGSLKELAQSIGNTSLRNMTIEQLSDVYDMYRMVLTRVRDANKTFLKDKKESISNLASRVVGEIRRVGGDHKYRAAVLDAVKKFGWNNLKPVYAFEHLGSQTLTEVFNAVRAGEDVWAVDVTEAREYYLDKSRKYGYDSWDFKKKHQFEATDGQKFELTLEQILSLYAYSKREQAFDHLRLGGFVFDSNIETYKEEGSKLIKYKVNTADAHQISVENLAKITGTLTKEQMAFVDEMQEYLSTVMGAKGNEITMAMYGVKLFKEKFYFPLKSAKQFMFEQNEVSGEVRIKNSGFTNKVVAKANNPVILSNFMDVWAGHVNDMSMYHAFVLPLEDFNRIFNFNSPKQEGKPPVSVKGTIQNAYSPAAVNYVKQLITDLNGGARSDPATDFLNKMMGLFKKGSVFASLSVVVQQPSAIARAAALVDTKYFIGPKVDHKRHKALWEEVKKYAPVAIIKEMGYFDTNMGKSTQDFIQAKEYDGFQDKMKALVTDSGYRDEILSKAPALADELAWCSIWEAVKRETKAKYPGLDTKAEPFLKLCGSRFTEVITKTQVYDSILARSAHMRSKDTGMKMVTAFMAEPTTSINMAYDALLQGKRGNRKYARNAIGAVVASQILNSILVSFVYAGRDDDEDETYLEKYIGTLTGEILDSLNPAGYIPFIKDIMSIVQGYDVERSDMAVFSDLWNAWQNLGKDNMSAYRKVEGFAGSIAQIFGLPVKNIMRDARAIYQTIESFVNGQQTTKAGIGYAVKGSVTGKDVSKQDQLYEAYLSGDEAQIARVVGRYKDQAAANNAMRTAIKERYTAGDISAETAIDYLVEYTGLEEADAYWKLQEWEYEGKSEDEFGKYNKFYEAVQTGANIKAVIKEYTDNGVEMKTLKSQISSHFRPLYIEMTNAEKAKIKGYLLNAFELCGYDRTDAADLIAEWEYEANHPELVGKITFSQYKRWETDGKPKGVSLDLFTDVAEFRDDGTSDSVKSQEEVAEYINSLSVSKAQKDALWCCFWKESTLKNAPWH